MKFPGIPNLPSVELAFINHMPEVPAIYFALDALGTVIYVGKAQNLRSRWAQHHRYAQLAEIGSVRIAWLELESPRNLDRFEQACIERFTPRLNNSRVPSGDNWRRLPPPILARLYATVARTGLHPDYIVTAALDQYLKD